MAVIKSISRTPTIAKRILIMGDQLRAGERTIRELVIFSDEEITDEVIEERKEEVLAQIEDVRKARVNFVKLAEKMAETPRKDKRRFRRVIAPELARDPFLARLFDGWGGHVDLFASELGKVSGYSRNVYTKHAERRAVERLDLDVPALRELGADYVLSALEIRNHAALGLAFERRFERADSPWEIFLYSLGADAP